MERVRRGSWMRREAWMRRGSKACACWRGLALSVCAGFACIACAQTPRAPDRVDTAEEHPAEPAVVATTTQSAQEAAPKPNVAPTRSPPPQALPNVIVEVALPADWASTSREKFADDLDRLLPLGSSMSVRLDADSIATLARALRLADESSVRAAAILGRTRDPRSADVLLARLEARVAERPDTLYAGDVVAAAAFSSGMLAPDVGARLEALARAPKPHPVLDVRVECAVASLGLGRDGAIPFLLALLREGTPAQDPRPDFQRLDPDDERLLRLQDRAARALSDRVGIECAFRAHASIAARESETTRLENLVSKLAGARAH